MRRQHGSTGEDAGPAARAERSMRMRWFSDEDRQAMRDAAEEQWVLLTLVGVIVAGGSGTQALATWQPDQRPDGR